MVVIIVDTLRADHAFGKRARTPNIDALAREGLSFTRFYPEAMPTVPARRSILTGRRVFPFRGWHPYRGLLAEPGWAPIADVRTTFTSALRRAGYWTAYVTDNTSLGFSPPWGPFRRSFDRFVRRGGQIGGTSAGVSERELRHWLPPEIEDPDTRDRVRRYLANGRYSHDETHSFAARVFRDGARVLDAAVAPAPVRARGRHLRAARAVDAPAPLHRHVRRPRLPRARAGAPLLRAGQPLPARAHAARCCSSACGPCTPAEVTMTDRWLGVFMDRFHELGLERDTVIVLVSDHGFYLGDYGYTGKIATVLHPAADQDAADRDRPAPAATRGAPAPTARRPTTSARRSCRWPGVGVPRGMDGVDLSRFFEGKRPPERPYSFGGYGNSYYVRTDHWAMYGAQQRRRLPPVRPRPRPGRGARRGGLAPGQGRASCTAWSGAAPGGCRRSRTSAAPAAPGARSRSAARRSS